MSWATTFIQKLKRNENVTFRPKGHSMHPKIKNNQLVTVSPTIDDLKVGDVVLCKVNNNQYLHNISAIHNGRFQISNNKGYVNGWITIDYIYGKCIKCED